ncbi:hypothetical protein EON63_14075 [archaeon]|nr:MAG: hypothetical protein EON63_14075 [archaeon]
MVSRQSKHHLPHTIYMHRAPYTLQHTTYTIHHAICTIHHTIHHASYTNHHTPRISGKCNFDGAKSALTTIYGELNARTAAKTANLMSFSQKPYFTNTKASIDDTGYIYVPTACQGGESKHIITFTMYHALLPIPYIVHYITILNIYHTPYTMLHSRCHLPPARLSARLPADPG